MRQVGFKSGVALYGLQPEMLYAIDICIRIFGENHKALVITSAKDGKHSNFSHHYKGLAIDLRVWEIEQEIVAYCQEIGRELGKNYQVINEGDHIHIEYDPQELPL
jgi:hypothetical protein